MSAVDAAAAGFLFLAAADWIATVDFYLAAVHEKVWGEASVRFQVGAFVAISLLTTGIAVLSAVYLRLISIPNVSTPIMVGGLYMVGIIPIAFAIGRRIRRFQ